MPKISKTGTSSIQMIKVTEQGIIHPKQRIMAKDIQLKQVQKVGNIIITQKVKKSMYPKGINIIILVSLIYLGCSEDKKSENATNYRNSNSSSNNSSSYEYNYSEKESITSGKVDLIDLINNIISEADDLGCEDVMSEAEDLLSEVENCNSEDCIDDYSGNVDDLQYSLDECQDNLNNNNSNQSDNENVDENNKENEDN